ncbi:MAG TPA: hypothetical protein VFQ35_23445 [Polyangiaceae bacterium]|nr:hypothetical protein [Polyangiaceae bacterium]
MRKRPITLRHLTIIIPLLFSAACSGSGGDPAQGSGGAGGTSGDPLNAPPTCTSKMTWTRGENAQMRPGEACISCHTQDGGPRFSIAGTVYPTGHEPDDCNGAAGATIVIVDAQNREHRITANAVGNFYLEQTIAVPYTAHVIGTNGERFMVSPQTSGDCNGCHTEWGHGAPGRINIP